MDSFSDSSEDVLNDLDPLSRALLDLSVQRGMDDGEIAQVLGTDEASVHEVRVGLLRNLAQKVVPEQAEADLPELEAAVATRLYPEVAGAEEPPAEPEPAEEETAVEADDLGDEVDEAELEEAPTEAEAAAEPEPEAEAEPEPEAEPQPDAEAEPEPEPQPQTVAAEPAPARERRRSPLVYVLPAVLLVAIVGLIVALASGGDDDESDAPSEPAAQQTQPDRPADGERQPTRVTALGSSKVTGTAALDGDRLTLGVRGLPDPRGGAYTAWLYDNVIDAKRIGTVRGGKLDAKLPEDAGEYEFIDVSREPDDGNPNHSGESVVRVELKKLGG